jgi:hypothetical protein
MYALFVAICSAYNLRFCGYPIQMRPRQQFTIVTQLLVGILEGSKQEQCRCM